MHCKIISVPIHGQGNMKQNKSLFYVSSLSIQISTVKTDKLARDVIKV